VNGPVSVADLRHLVATGQLLPTDQVRKEDMERWVKARAVKGLFAPTADRTPPPGPTDGDTMFDFFGAGPPATTPVEEPVSTEPFNAAFDFFGVGPPPSAAPAAEVEMYSAAAPPARKSSPPRKSKAVPPPVPVTEPAPVETGSFRISTPATAPAESRVDATVPFADFSDVPFAAPIAEDEVPFADPASAVGISPPPVTLTAVEVALQPDGTAAPTDRTVELALSGGWLAVHGDGQQTYLRLSRLEAVVLRDRPQVGLVLSVHGGRQAVAVRCDDAEAARAFLRRLLDAAG
jgi:hypothetical protein